MRKKIAIQLPVSVEIDMGERKLDDALIDAVQQLFEVSIHSFGFHATSKKPSKAAIKRAIKEKLAG